MNEIYLVKKSIFPTKIMPEILHIMKNMWHNVICKNFTQALSDNRASSIKVKLFNDRNLILVHSRTVSNSYESHG